MRLQLISWAAVLALAGGVVANQDNDRYKLPFTSKDLEGEWITSCAPASTLGFPSQDRWLIRYSVLDRAAAYTRWSFYTDEACQQPIYSVFFTYFTELGEPSDKLPNTREARNIYSRISLNPSTDAGLELFKPCGSEVIGREVDITETGCNVTGIPPVRECPSEYELYTLIPGKTLATGVRNFKYCLPEGRPTRVQDQGLATLLPGY